MDVEQLVPEAGNLAGFIEQFPIFAAAPNGVSKLREMILQLAITGRLTEQKVSDDFAIELLSDAKAKKKIYEQTLNIRKAKTISPLNDDDYPYLIPSHWAWCQLNDLACYIQRGKGPKYSENDSSLVVSQKCIQWSGFDISKARGIDELSLEKYGKERFLIDGDLLWNSTGTGTVGRVNIIENTDQKSIVVDSHVTIIRLSNVEPRYIWCCISSPWVQSRIEPDHENALVSGSTKQVELSTAAVKELPIALPPLEEQKRIVAKVDELMALCDKLEAQQQQQAQNVLRANTAAINALLNPAPQQSENKQKTSESVSANTPETPFEQNWQRIAQHFNTLYGCTLPMPKGEGRQKKHLVGLENVKALRKTILHLGSTAKLVNPSNFKGNNQQYRDILLHDKEQKINDGLVKKEKKNNAIIKEANLEKVSLWEYLTLGELFDFIDYRGKTPSKVSNGIPLITAKNIRPGYINREPAEAITFEDYQSWMTRGFPQIGDILFTTEAPLGNVAIVDIQQKFALAQRCINLQPYSKVNSTFFMYVMMSDFFQIQLLENATGITAQGIKAAKLKKLLLPVPSLEEQKRIVAKVDQLMTLCDQLEQQLTQSYGDAEKLMQATVKALTV